MIRSVRDRGSYGEFSSLVWMHEMRVLNWSAAIIKKEISLFMRG
jgi:hypothetical protein